MAHIALAFVLLTVGTLASDASTEVNLTDGEKRALANLGIEELPQKLRRAVLDVVDATKHWCCKIHPTKVIVNSRAVQQYAKKAQQHTHYAHCGFWGWGRCAQHSVTYYKASVYNTAYTKKTVATTCPDRDVVCCNEFIQVAKNCLPISELPKHQQELQNLKNQGLLVG